MKKYELLLTLPGTLDDDEVKRELQKVINIVKEYSEGEIEQKSLGKVRLAYAIKQIRYGYYYTLVFAAEPNKMPELDKKLRLNAGLLRAIINLYNEAAKDITPILSSTPIKFSRRPEVKEKITLAEALEDKKEEAGAISLDPVKNLNVIEGEKTAFYSTADKAADQRIDLNEIDKKLDKILEGNDVI